MLVPPLGQDDPLEKGMATHSSILYWKIPWTEEPRGLQSIESQRVKHNCSNLVPAHTHTHTHTHTLSLSLSVYLCVSFSLWLHEFPWGLLMSRIHSVDKLQF